MKREKNETGSEEDVKSQMRVENDVLYRRMGVGMGVGDEKAMRASTYSIPTRGHTKI